MLKVGRRWLDDDTAGQEKNMGSNDVRSVSTARGTSHWCTLFEAARVGLDPAEFAMAYETTV